MLKDSLFTIQVVLSDFSTSCFAYIFVTSYLAILSGLCVLLLSPYVFDLFGSVSKKIKKR